MKTFEYVITEAVGIHARPASMLTKKATEFKSAVTLTNGEKSADVKKLLALMALGVKKDAKITVTVEGEDEDIAAEALEQFFQENL